MLWQRLERRNSNLTKKPRRRKVSCKLHLAARFGRVEMVESLIEARGYVNEESYDDGKTALIHAANAGHLTVAQLLIEFKADVNVEDYDGDTALMHAARAGHLEVVRLLIENNANMNTR